MCSRDQFNHVLVAGAMAGGARAGGRRTEDRVAKISTLNAQHSTLTIVANQDRVKVEERLSQSDWCEERCADTNGAYYDEPSWSLEDGVPDFAEHENLIAPGSFEFELSDHPSVLIFSAEGSAKTQSDQCLGRFLANLMPKSRSPRPAFVREPEREYTSLSG